MKLKINTPIYNKRRYGKPYIAKMAFHTAKGEPSWGEWVGEPGCEGLLIIDAKPGDIIMRGQRDNRNMKNSVPEFFVLNEKGELERVSKKDAYVHFNS